MPVSTGSATLDGMLDGGLPADRTVLVTGEPGTGKSTLAMQFLQAGLDRGEQVGYVSTEQTPEEVRSSFVGFGFDLEHDRFAITTVHAAAAGSGPPNRREETVRMVTLGGESALDRNDVLLTGESLVQYLRQGGPFDRIVIDSVSGLRAMAGDDSLFRRAVLDLVRLFTDEFGATALLVAEGDDGASRALRYNTHGVIRLWRDAQGSEKHHYLEVEKMRGVPHDRRPYEMEFDAAGVRVLPRTSAGVSCQDLPSPQPTGIDGLDRLTGGGLMRGGLNVLLTCGRSMTEPLHARMQERALADGYTLVLVPPPSVGVDRLTRRLDRRAGESLMDAGKLIVLDLVAEREPIHERHFVLSAFDGDLIDLFGHAYDRAGDAPVFASCHLEPVVQAAGADTAREARYWMQANRVGPDDVVLYQLAPSALPPQLGEFYVSSSRLALETYVAELGIQYIALRKSPLGSLGSSRVVEFPETGVDVEVQADGRGGEFDWGAGR